MTTQRQSAPPLAVAALVLLPLVVTGCGPRNFLNDNDAVRRENLELRKQVQTLEDQVALRAGQLASLQADLAQQRSGSPVSTEGVDAPVLSGVTLDRYSGPLDLDNDGLDEVLRLYVYPVDQKSRFLSTAGTLTVRLASVPAEGEPVLLFERTVSPAEFDASYRAGFTGPYYRVDLPLPPATPSEVVVRITLSSAVNGVTFSDQASYRVVSSTGEAPVVR